MILAKVLLLVWLGLALGLNGKPQVLSQPIPQDTLITLRRTGCFYTCSDYLVTISANGTVTYEGYANVKVKGRVQTQITREKVELLIAAFAKAKYFSLRDRYSLPEDGCRLFSGDSPSANTSITIKGKSKSVNHYLGCFPKRGSSVRTLIKLEKEIDEIAGTDQWVG
jgi:hypothetical protein